VLLLVSTLSCKFIPESFVFLPMTGESPSRRLPAETAKFTSFSRGVGHSSSQTQKEPSGNLEVPSSDTEGSLKRKVTRIQLFGRSPRKKLNQSTALSPFVSSGDSSDLGDLSVRAASSDR
jgi:hypothetical protein